VDLDLSEAVSCGDSACVGFPAGLFRDPPALPGLRRLRAKA